MPFLVRLLERERQHGVIGAREAHVDDAGALGDRPFDAGEDMLGRGLRRFDAVRLRAERMDREDAGVRRDAEQLAMGDDGAGHLGAVLVRLVAVPDGIELTGEWRR